MITCTFEDGKKIVPLRHVTVGTIILNEKNKVLLVKRAPGLMRGNKYTIPGGFLDRDEDLVDGALRELREESGLNGEILFLFKINDNPNRPREEARQNVDFIFIGKIIGGKEKISNETTEVKWFSEKDLPGKNDFAFDHREIIEMYFKYLKKPFKIPFFGSNKII
ncbi:MAG: NUDIX hydrolase [Patescibacteria group bacterium]|nr:NUDIX hydrolase [Patescibacteria group bacterium]